MNFEFELRSPIQATIIEADAALIVRGQVTASTPRRAATKIINGHRPDLDDGFAGLAPDFTVSRNQDGSFSIDVDTHGLVDATIELEQIS